MRIFTTLFAAAIFLTAWSGVAAADGPATKDDTSFKILANAAAATPMSATEMGTVRGSFFLFIPGGVGVGFVGPATFRPLDHDCVEVGVPGLGFRECIIC